MKETSCLFKLIYETLQEGTSELNVKELCMLAGVSRTGYYAWVKSAPVRAALEEQDKKDFEKILEAFIACGYEKGARAIYMYLIHLDQPVIMNLKKIRRLMHKYHLVCTIRKKDAYKKMLLAIKSHKVVPNILQREFELYGPRVVLLTDISYIPYNGTFAYLSTIIDAFTKQILSYVVSESLEEDFVLETVKILVRDHGISLYQETILHSDQGVHYTCYKFIEILKDNNIRQSMSRKGNCWDNAPQESFFGHMKDHIRENLKKSTTFEEAKKIIDNYIDYYNNKRYQWELAKLSPNEFYDFFVSGIYPLKVDNPPKAPTATKSRDELNERFGQHRETANV